ncbi:MAG TPA: VOC family protein [Acetobacteraceae bacterium]|nr:VOC family protein [Acetobacteraceae bacterium]
MKLKFSHVDILVKDLDAAVSYYKAVLGCTSSERKVWNRDGFHVEYIIMFNGDERFFLVQPYAGNLKTLLEEKGEGTIYRLCYTVPDMAAAYDELIAAGVQPENENGVPVGKDNLESPSGTRIIWLPKAFGNLSIELLEEASLEGRMKATRLASS